MALEIGSRLGHYNVTALIGEGGMGQVYQATDTKLNRQVALKILPEAFADDPDRLARFQREAQVLASLNHPNIAAIHGLEDSGDTKALVLELVEGPTLADRIKQGPVPLDEALPIAKQIAEALEAAHEAGVIHRDLKPANIKVREDGTVKVLDFGLAKALDPNPAGDPSQSPTLTAAATQMGVIMGTAAYMSPEQARGKPVDKRTDIWAFGCVLYEMLTGERAFVGGDVSLTLAKVLEREPSLESLPDTTPPKLRNVLQRCLEKEPRQRVQAIGDVRLAMEGAFETSTRPSRATNPSSALVSAGTAFVVGAVAASLTVWSLMSAVPATSPIVRFQIPLPAETFEFGLLNNRIALSPDGTKLALIGSTQLYLRALDQQEAEPLGGTEGAVTAFFSADGEWIGFWADGYLKKIPVEGGVPITLAESSRPFGASWASDDSILLGSIGDEGGIWRVPGRGGTPALVIPKSDDDRGIATPQLLPGGEWVLAREVPSDRIAIYSMVTGERRVLIEDGGDARYLPTGHLVYVRDDTLVAMPFDAKRLEITGGPVPVLDQVRQVGGLGRAQLSYSDDGILVYQHSGVRLDETRTLVWTDRVGSDAGINVETVEAGYYGQVRLSPNGRRAALQVGPLFLADIAVADFDTGVVSQVTFDEGMEVDPVWSPDGAQIAFATRDDIRLKRLGEEAESILVERTGPRLVVEDWSPDGQWLIYREADTLVHALAMVGQQESRLLNDSPAKKDEFRFSPDGRWLSYQSDESGRFEVYVTEFPAWTRKRQVSIAGGGMARWSPDGLELFYVDLQGRLNSVAVTTTSEGIETGPPSPLFDIPLAVGYLGVDLYDIAPDGDHFVTIQARDEQEHLEVVLNWFEELKRLVPTE